jgi:hypothetical protein
VTNQNNCNRNFAGHLHGSTNTYLVSYTFISSCINIRSTVQSYCMYQTLPLIRRCTWRQDIDAYLITTHLLVLWRRLLFGDIFQEEAQISKQKIRSLYIPLIIYLVVNLGSVNLNLLHGKWHTRFCIWNHGHVITYILITGLVLPTGL